MKKIITISLLCAMCALQSCKTSTEFKEVEKIVYQDPTYDVKSISLSENSLLFKTKETALESKVITLNVDSEQEIPTNAYYIVSYDEDVATAAFNDKGELVITPVDKGTTEIVVSLQNKVARCAVEVRTTYFDLGFAKAICDFGEGFVLGDDGDIDIEDNADAIAALTELGVSEKGLTSLAGVEYLTALTVLDCSTNLLTSLDMTLCPQLEGLDCSINSLSELDLTQCTQLKGLVCYYTNITSLDLTNCTLLEQLICYMTPLTSLDVSKCTQLEELNCDKCQLTSLDLSKCAALDELDCSGNPLLTSINLSNCTKLTELNCDENPLLASLNVSDCTELDELYCEETAIALLDISNCKQLTSLNCSYCDLSTLDISMCSSISYLICGDQKSGELTLSLTDAQSNNVWPSFQNWDGNDNVVLNITDID